MMNKISGMTIENNNYSFNWDNRIFTTVIGYKETDIKIETKEQFRNIYLQFENMPYIFKQWIANIYVTL